MLWLHWIQASHTPCKAKGASASMLASRLQLTNRSSPPVTTSALQDAEGTTESIQSSHSFSLSAIAKLHVGGRTHTALLHLISRPRLSRLLLQGLGVVLGTQRERVHRSVQV